MKVTKNKYITVDNSGTVWGLGDTIEEAQHDAVQMMKSELYSDVVARMNTVLCTERYADACEDDGWVTPTNYYIDESGARELETEFC